MKLASNDELLYGMMKMMTGKVHVQSTGEKGANNSPCNSCIHARSLVGDAHILCSNPPRAIEALEHGIGSGWFMFPINFDPNWRAGECSNFQQLTKGGQKI